MPVRFLLSAVVLTVSCVEAIADDTPENDIPSALNDYVQRPEKRFSWKLQDKLQLDAGTVYSIELVSQEWQGIVWKHALHIHEPRKLIHPRHVLLFVTGGRNGQQPGKDRMARGLKLAALCGARVATLYQVPNQPLLGDRVEDDLITEIGV